MIIDFSKMEEQCIPSFKGGEKSFNVKMFDDGSNKVMLGRLESGASIGLHTHEGNCEILYVIEGSGKVLFNDGEERVEKGTCHYCPEGSSHSLINDGEGVLTFFAVVPNK
jgi:mannose-6-phosphate isomerase-like protein (cupin superfamily)